MSGFVGNFKVKVKRYPRYIDEDKCVGCGECIETCVYKEGKYANAFDLGLAKRKPIYMPFPQAVPPVPLIDARTCIEFKSHKCPKGCVEVCGDRNAIDFNQPIQEIELEVGTMIMSTGFKTFDPHRLPQYGYGKFPNVYTSLEIERLVNASGPTQGQVTMKMAGSPSPSASSTASALAMRTPTNTARASAACTRSSWPISSRKRPERASTTATSICVPRAKVLRSSTSACCRKASLASAAKSSEVSGWPQSPAERKASWCCSLKIRWWVNSGGIPVDMVVLSAGLEPQEDSEAVRRMFNLGCSAEGWFLERHPKLAPVDTFTDGIYLAGCCQGPKDIPDTVAQAGAAAAQALSLICRGYVEMEPNTAWIDEEALLRVPGVCRHVPLHRHPF